MEALDVGAEGTCGRHAWREDAAACILEFILIVSVRLLVDFVYPLRCKLLIIQRRSSKIGPLIALNRQWSLIWQALHDNAEVADAVLGSVPVHLVEV